MKLKTPSDEKLLIAVILGMVVGTLLLMIAKGFGLVFWIHVICIFVSLGIVKVVPNIYTPRNNRYLEKVDLNGVFIVFIVVFGVSATVFILITLLMAIKRERKGVSDATN